VIREALRALADGQPRLLRLSRNPPVDSRRGDGVVEYLMTCHSGGTLEIYVEPHLPVPALWIAGTTPIASALVELGAATGYRVTLVDPDALASAFPAASRVLTEPDLASPDPEASPYVVVASQGQWDEEALAGALRRSSAYVGLVASPTRATAVRAYLRESGVPDDALARLRAPAGLDLGAESPEEIALSILAELTALRHGREAVAPAPGRAAAHAGWEAAAAIDGSTPGVPATASTPANGSAGATSGGDAAIRSTVPSAGEIVLRDPVCGMTVDAEDVRHIAEHGGIVYAFCCLSCRSRFVKDPDRYLAASSTTR